MYAVQQIASEHGGYKRFLSNYAITLMVIAYLQEKNILPKLQHHRETLSPDQTPSAPHTPMQKTSPQQQQNARPAAKPAVTSMSRNQKRAMARQNRRRRNQGGNSGHIGSADVEARIAADVVQVATLNGTRTKRIDCHFDKVMAQNKTFGKRCSSTVGDLLSGFLAYFGFLRNSTGYHEVSVVYGSLNHETNMTTTDTASNASTSTRTAPDNNVNTLSTPTSQRSTSSSKSVIVADTSAGSKGSKATTEKPEQQPANPHRFSGLIVRDPFVTDRNVAKLCSGWKLAATLACFRRAFMTLQDEDLSSDDKSYLDDLDDMDDSSDVDSDDDSYDDEVDGDDEGSADDRKRRRWRYRRRSNQVALVRHQGPRRPPGAVGTGSLTESALAAALVEELSKDMLFLVVGLE